MKKEIVAGAILILLLAGSVINMNVIVHHSDEMSRRVALSEKLYFEGRREEAVQTVKDTLKAWNDWDSYTHIMLRHTEIELVIGSFYDLITALESANGASASDYERMQTVLRGIANAERCRLGSIL